MYKIAVISAFILLSMMNLAFAEYKAGMAGSPWSGAKWEETSCPQGTYAVGIRVTGTQYVEFISFQCGGSGEIINRAGLGATDPYNLQLSRTQIVFCRGSRRLTGIKFKSGSYVDRVASIRCQNRNGGDTEFLGVGIGGTGGNDVRAYCRSGDRVTRLGGHVGRWIDHVNVYCD